MSEALYPFVARAGKPPAYGDADERIGMLATSKQTGNTFILFHQIGNEKTINPIHYHTHDYGLYVLKGHLTFHFSERDLKLQDGDYITIPRLTEYSWEMDTAGTEILIFQTPAGSDQIVIGGSNPAASTEHHEALWAQYGVTVLDKFSPKRTASLDPASLSLFAQPQVSVTNAETAPAYWVSPAIPELWTLLAAGSQTNNSYTLTHMLIPHAGNLASPMSYHARDESYYILSGKVTVLLDAEIVTLEAGDFVCIPRGTVFSVRADSDGLSMLVWHTPSGLIEGCVPLFGAVPAGVRSRPPSDLKKPDVDPVMMIAHGRALGLRFLAVGDPLKQ
jgi:mannose-6-phosphate isomerase-like protein (cupin superfamily)